MEKGFHTALPMSSFKEKTIRPTEFNYNERNQRTSLIKWRKFNSGFAIKFLVVKDHDIGTMPALFISKSTDTQSSSNRPTPAYFKYYEQKRPVFVSSGLLMQL